MFPFLEVIYSSLKKHEFHVRILNIRNYKLIIEFLRSMKNNFMIISHFWCSNFFTYLSEICKIFLQVLDTNFEEIYCLGVLLWGFIAMTPARNYRKKHDFAAPVWSQRVDPETGAEMGSKLSDSLCSCTGKPAGTQNKALPGSNYILSFKMII